MEILACQLDRSNSTPLYEQLYLYIKQEITEGRLGYGEKLPSKRNFAAFLKVSQNTIETAYEQLIAEGFVEGRARKGYFVLAYEDLEYIQTPTTKRDKQRSQKQSIRYNFHPSWIDTASFPFTKWRKHAKTLLSQEHHGLLLMGSWQGELELREEIAHYLYHARGVKCDPEQIIVGAGSELLLQQLVLLFGERAVYGVEDPGYHVISRILAHYPNHVYPLRVDGEGLDVGALEGSNVQLVYTTPSHHFPYGAVLSANRRVQLLNWASSKENHYIVEDDYDSEFRYSGKSIPALKSMDKAEKVIYLGSFSKSLIPSLRISYMVLPKGLLPIYRDLFSYFHCSVSRIDQHILARFMQAGDFERHLNRMRKIYRRKLDKTLKLLKPYASQINVIGEHSGLHMMLSVHNGMDEKELVERAKKANIKIHSLSAYSLSEMENSAPKIVLGFAGILEEELEIAIPLLLKSWQIE
ncbi:MocR-like pyridoxine biosynthesis transcription factor PdxR [Virgibacillus sp. MG-45]|uniref:MocR-like pyridoxine biosynthesis transcription factor PdxR n=1 Tax=Virgibacillus sp. MG-45 TaxID=3102791 RepID=UPI002EDA08BE